MANQVTNAMVAAINEKIPDEIQEQVDQLVTAGMTVMHSEKSHEMMLNQLRAEGDVLENIGEGVAKLVGILWKDAQGNIDIKAVVPAGMILLCNVMEFASEAGMVELSNATLAQATKEFTSSFLQLMGATPENMPKIMERAKQEKAINDLPPDQADAMIRQMGETGQAGAAPQEQGQPADAGVISGAMQQLGA